MKNKIQTFTLLLTFLGLMIAQPVSSQDSSSLNTATPFALLTFANVQSKILAPQPRFSLMAEIGSRLRIRGDKDFYQGSEIKQLNAMLFEEEALFDRLMESLGGEFFIGEFSGPGVLKKERHTLGLNYGVNIGYEFHPKWHIQASFGQYNEEVKAKFPVTVFDFQNGEPRSQEGNVSTALKRQTFQLLGIFFPMEGRIRPFIGTGFLGIRRQATLTKATINTITIDLIKHPIEHHLGIVFATGLEWEMTPVLVIRINAKMEGVHFSKSTAWDQVLSFGVGLRL